MELNEESATLLAKKPTNAKAAIIKKLSHSWPITAKQMTTILQREFGIAITYQGVHKALTQLEEEKIIEKGEKGYQLNSDWIKNIQNIASSIAKNYNNNESLDFEKEIIQLNFQSWISVGRFGSFTFKDDFPNPLGKPIVTCWMHVWPVSTVSAEESKHLIEQAIREKAGLYCLTNHNTPLDQLFADWIGKMGRKNVLGAEIPLDHDYIIRGDHIAHIYYENSFRKKLDNFYQKNVDVKNIDYQRLQELATERTLIQVIIIKNRQFAETLRSEALKFFKNR
ncbi:MAG: hypothetical protein IPJ89_05125 [Candidatus Iainarchaeum archaeon]|uniref:Uncharacterized protein n=1 Tax=Candidatus Iainarchaeum sp. TaxID=3101447 RepID=A0A7T9DJI0_9ARCH|nr:MAG: hypothetical protein IPJ89_05125 [Candidatus Diapherotrites archaeon]